MSGSGSTRLPSATNTPSLGTGPRYQGVGPRQSRFTRGWKILALLALLLAILLVAIVPAAVITTRNKNNSAQDSAEIVETTVVDGVTITRTRTGNLVTQTRLSTAANGEVKTLTSVITAAPITVSRTSFGGVATGIVTTTISGQVLALLTVTETIQSAASTVVVFTTNGSYRVYDFEYGQHDAANYLDHSDHLEYRADHRHHHFDGGYDLVFDHGGTFDNVRRHI